MKTGFDAVYVVFSDINTLEYECLYDIFTAREEVVRLIKEGKTNAHVCSLEEAYRGGGLHNPCSAPPTAQYTAS